MAVPRFESLSDYLASLTPAKAKTLGAVIDLILGEFPGLELKLAWNTPQIHRDGKYVFGLSSLKKNLDLAPWSEDIMSGFKARLEGDGYAVRKNLFQVPDDGSIDRELVLDLVRARIAELDAGKK